MSLSERLLETVNALFISLLDSNRYTRRIIRGLGEPYLAGHSLEEGLEAIRHSYQRAAFHFSKQFWEYETAEKIVKFAYDRNLDVTLDMEDHCWTTASLEAAQQLWKRGADNLGKYFRELGCIVRDYMPVELTPGEGLNYMVRRLKANPGLVWNGMKNAMEKVAEKIRGR
ncbi:MAG: hypothetical protein AABX13_02705 [Nanoarchaeota archaeon]